MKRFYHKKKVTFDEGLKADSLQRLGIHIGGTMKQTTILFTIFFTETLRTSTSEFWTICIQYSFEFT